MDLEYFDKDGVQIYDPARVQELYDDEDYRLVALDRLEPGIVIRTEWTGVDYDKAPGPQQIFNTTLFDSQSDRDYWSYATLAEAQAGHQQVLAETTARHEAALAKQRST